MQLSVDLDNVKELIESYRLADFLINNTTDVGTAAFVLNAVETAYNEARQQVEADEVDSN